MLWSTLVSPTVRSKPTRRHARNSPRRDRGASPGPERITRSRIGSIARSPARRSRPRNDRHARTDPRQEPQAPGRQRPVPTKPIKSTTANAKTAALTRTSASELPPDAQATAARERPPATRRRAAAEERLLRAAPWSRPGRARTCLSGRLRLGRTRSGDSGATGELGNSPAA